MADAIFAVGSLFFAAALLPSVFGPDKPALWTSITTGFWLVVFAVTYMTLDLNFAAASTALSGALWLTLAAQKWRSRPRW
jgi:hypothetical protein